MSMKIRSVLTLCIFIVMSVLNVGAQEIRFGILSGFNVTRTNISEYTVSAVSYGKDQKDPMASFNINGYFEYKSAGLWGLAVEPGYIRKGGSNPVNHDGKTCLNYFEVPVLVNLYISERLYVSLGPGVSYLLNVKYHYKSDSYDIPVSGNRYEISGLIGINYDILKNMGIGLRYNQGWATINKRFEDGKGNVLYTMESKEVHQSLQLIVRFFL